LENVKRLPKNKLMKVGPPTGAPLWERRPRRDADRGQAGSYRILGFAWVTASWESKLELLPSCVPKLELGNKKTASWESKLELLPSCVPKLELGNKKKEKIEAGASAQLCSEAGAWEQQEQYSQTAFKRLL
jgi:hypothetical protein